MYTAPFMVNVGKYRVPYMDPAGLNWSMFISIPSYSYLVFCYPPKNDVNKTCLRVKFLDSFPAKNQGWKIIPKNLSKIRSTTDFWVILFHHPKELGEIPWSMNSWLLKVPVFCWWRNIFVKTEGRDFTISPIFDPQPDCEFVLLSFRSNNYNG